MCIEKVEEEKGEKVESENGVGESIVKMSRKSGLRMRKLRENM